jgi:hypothetical protein
MLCIWAWYAHLEYYLYCASAITMQLQQFSNIDKNYYY